MTKNKLENFKPNGVVRLLPFIRQEEEGKKGQYTYVVCAHIYLCPCVFVCNIYMVLIACTCTYVIINVIRSHARLCCWSDVLPPIGGIK